MIKSMTGYSKVSVQEAGVSATASLKSTNHRFLDVQVRLPAGLESLEPLVRRVVRESVARGHLEITIAAEQDHTAGLQIDHKLVQAYATACQNLRSSYGFSGEPDPVSVLRIPGVVTGSNGEISPAELELMERVVVQAARQGLSRLNEMRAGEGGVLELDLRHRLQRLRQLCEGVAQSHQDPSVLRCKVEMVDGKACDPDARRAAWDSDAGRPRPKKKPQDSWRLRRKSRRRAMPATPPARSASAKAVRA